MDRPLLYDVFAGSGGASMGYSRAGFRVIGIDNNPKPLRHYPFESICMDALEFLDRYNTGEFERASAFHASPPCQFASECVPIKYRSKTPNLIVAIRKRLNKAGVPYVIENVDNARKYLNSPIRLHGSMFSLRVHRSRYFETYPEYLVILLPCFYPSKNPIVPSGHTNRKINGKRIPPDKIADIRDAMDMPWATRKEISEAIHPAYTEYIGKYLMQAVMDRLR